MITASDDYDTLQVLTVDRSNDVVYERLRAAIIDGDLRPGQRLVEARLSERFGLSRAPIREAMRLLERDGLVQSLPRRGSTVVMLNKDDVREIYGLRAALECAAIRDVAREATPEFLDQLETMVEAMQQESRASDIALLSSADVAFHSAICEFAGNARLYQAWSSMHAQIRLLSRQVIGTLYSDLSPIPQRHEAILDAIRGGDMDAAEHVLRAHISSVADRIVAAFPTSL